MARHGVHPEIVTLGIDDRFVEHGKPQELYADCGYDSNALQKAILGR